MPRISAAELAMRALKAQTSIDDLIGGAPPAPYLSLRATEIRREIVGLVPDGHFTGGEWSLLDEYCDLRDRSETLAASLVDAPTTIPGSNKGTIINPLIKLKMTVDTRIEKLGVTLRLIRTPGKAANGKAQDTKPPWE